MNPNIQTTDEIAVDFGGRTYHGVLDYDPADAVLVMLEAEGPERFSTNLQCYGLVAAPGCVFVKDWSEHSGLAAALQEAGLVRIVRNVEVGPFASTAYEVEVKL